MSAWLLSWHVPYGVSRGPDERLAVEATQRAAAIGDVGRRPGHRAWPHRGGGDRATARRGRRGPPMAAAYGRSAADRGIFRCHLATAAAGTGPRRADAAGDRCSRRVGSRVSACLV